jgi:hypothetical protein
MKTYLQLIYAFCFYAVLLLSASCNSKSENQDIKASKASLDEAIVDLGKLIEDGNADELAKNIIEPSNNTPEGSKELAERLIKAKINRLFSFSESKISGDVGTVVLTIDAYSLDIAIMAKWEKQQWKFFMGLHDCASEFSISRLGLTEDQLKDALLLKEWLDNETQAFKSGIGARDRLKWYLPSVPDSVVIEKFYESPSPAMDHQYIWEIIVEDNDNFRLFETQLTQKPPNFHEENELSNSWVFDEHPSWWKSLDFESFERYQYIVEVVGSNDSERAYLAPFFDEKSGFLYISAGN